MSSCRERAFLAVANFENIPVYEALQDAPLSAKDMQLAREIAVGTVKRLWTLKYFAKKLAPKLHLNHKEKSLLFCAIYQWAFMDKIPDYAIVSETTTLAKKHFGEKKGKFFHAILRRLPEFKLEVPGKNNAFDLSYRLSYPPYFIKKMLEEYGVKKTIEILETMNLPGRVMLRLRKPLPQASLKKGIKHLSKDMYLVEKDLHVWAKKEEVYVQNSAPVQLFDSLARKRVSSPTRILDLCAAPGGKLLLSHDRFPKAELYANDVSPKKLALLQENVEKYNIPAKLYQTRGEVFSSKEPFDLIIIDAPCSNSGVYRKSAEARWRFTPDFLEDLSDLQAELLENALRYLTPDGEIWYMSCSILQEENEETISFANSLGLVCTSSQKLLPNKEGRDGGFACCFTRKRVTS